jgi:hypothetical protein
MPTTLSPEERRKMDKGKDDRKNDWDWRQKQPESFEITEYDADRKDQVEANDFSVIKEIVAEIGRDNPGTGFQVKFGAGFMQLVYVAYEMHFPQRKAIIEDAAKKGLNEALKIIKKEFRARTKKSISFKERKEMANNTVEKTSLNERYMYVSWRCYDLGG